METDTPPGAEGATTTETGAIKPIDLAEALGISRPYASLLLAGKRSWTQPLALKAWRATGHKLGGLEALTDDECEQLDRLTSAVREVAAPEAPAPTRPVVASGEGFAL
jgi:hypothetical protein